MNSAVYGQAPRASLERTLEFANEVREAGGGAFIHALAPSVPMSSKDCLIARNLNFDCRVTTLADGSSIQPSWVMVLSDLVLRDRIALKMGLATRDLLRPYLSSNGPGTHKEYAILLPRDIGQVAADFDRLKGEMRTLHDLEADGVEDTHPAFARTRKSIKDMAELWPYIEASAQDAYTHASFINDKGELVV